MNDSERLERVRTLGRKKPFVMFCDDVGVRGRSGVDPDARVLDAAARDEAALLIRGAYLRVAPKTLAARLG